MSLLKKENWWIWLLLTIFSQGTSQIVLGALLEVYDKEAWYAKWQNWLIGFLCLFFPAFIMFTVLVIQMLVLSAAKLEIKGKELYLSPYIWIMGLIIPFIGWGFIIFMLLYLEIGILIALNKGAGNKFILK